jgi:hypothetical protein
MTMRVLIIADRLFCSRERSLLSRLEVGLVDEGLRVIQAIPEDEDAEWRSATTDSAELYRSVVRYSARTVSITRAFAARQLVTEMTRAMGDSDAPLEIDLVHVFGGASWGLGAQVASQLDAQLLLEVWRGGLAERAINFARSLSGSSVPPVLVAPDPSIEKLIQEWTSKLDPPNRGIVAKPASWGVHVPAALRTVLPGGQAVTAALVGSGRDSRSFLAALEGVAAALAPCEDAVIFCDALAARRAGGYALAQSRGFLPRLTLIDELEARRELLLHADLLVHPDALGEHRSILLEAMASGMIVIAAADPMLSILIDGRTARLVSGSHPDAWRFAVESVLANPEGARQLAASAHQFVRSTRSASAHVRQVLGIYQWMVSNQSIPITSAVPKP